MSRVFPGALGNYLALAADVPALDILGAAAQVTVAAWVRPAVIDATTRSALGKGGGGTGITQYELGIDATNKPFTRINPASSVTEAAIGATTMVANVWQHIAGRKSAAGAGGLAVFLNGVLDGVFTASAAGVMDASQVFVIGGKTTGNFPWNGRVAEVAVWNVALTDTEILALGKGVCPAAIRRPALAGYWPLFGIGPEADFSGNLNTLPVTGAVPLGDHAPVGRIKLAA